MSTRRRLRGLQMIAVRFATLSALSRAFERALPLVLADDSRIGMIGHLRDARGIVRGIRREESFRL